MILMEAKKWYIRDIEIPNQIVIAPMAGISNPAFRMICKEFGASLIYTEMVSDKAIYYGNEKTVGMTKVEPYEHPLTMQLFGHDIETMVYTAKKLDQETDCDIIDINMGCPVTKIVKSQAGSALMKDIDHAVNMVKAIIENVKKPVTVKMRLGWDDDSINCIELAKRLEAVGVSAIALHGRTKKQMYEGKADWSYIKKMKEALSIPVIGNGDIKSLDDAIRMLEETNCDAIMIGRGCLGNPWLIKEISNYLETNEKTIEVSIHDRFHLAKRHAKALCDLKGEKVGMREMRGHATWYVKGLVQSNRLKDNLTKVNTYNEMVEVLDTYYEEHKQYYE